MADLTEVLQSATPEQLQEAGACKNVEELLTFAKAEGIDLNAEQAEQIFKMTHPSHEELSDQEMDAVAGGREKFSYVTCPRCNYPGAKSHNTKCIITCPNCNYIKLG